MKTERWEKNLDALRAGIDLLARIEELEKRVKEAEPHTVVINGKPFFKEPPCGDH